MDADGYLDKSQRYQVKLELTYVLEAEIFLTLWELLSERVLCTWPRVPIFGLHTLKENRLDSA